MGYIRHHAIIVTSWDEERMEVARNKAIEVFGELMVSTFVQSKVNGNISFFIGPDGSKEGWEESESSDVNRGIFIDWLKSQAFEDGSSIYSWVELFYGDDNGKAGITAHN